jgi:potassium voltage-gated channel Shaw-related subfamily C member 1
VLDRLDLDTDKPSEEELARKFGFEEDYFRGNLSWWQRTKPSIWSLFDEPYSSTSAKVFYSMFFSLIRLFSYPNKNGRADVVYLYTSCKFHCIVK